MECIPDNNRNQIGMLSLDQMVEPESMVKIINTFVEMLNLKEFDFNFFSLNKQGNPSYHWANMMKLHIYGLKKNIRTCRNLKKACKNNIEVILLVNEQRPHFKIIANFLKDNALIQEFDQKTKDKLQHKKHKKISTSKSASSLINPIMDKFPLSILVPKLQYFNVIV